MLKFRDFVPVSAGMKETLGAKISASEVKSCEFSFANLVMWGRSFDIRTAEYRGHVYFSETDDDDKERSLLFLPFETDEPDPAELHDVASSLTEEGFSGKYFCVDAGYLARHGDIERFFYVAPMGDGEADYIYEVENLVALPGAKGAKKRNLISQFLRQYPDVRTRRIDASLSAECLALAQAWRDGHTDKDPVEVAQEKAALEAAFADFDRLGFVGLAVYAQGKMIAFELCSPIRADLYDEHFEKTLPGFKGAAQFVNRETAKLVSPLAKYLNREQDMDIPGLRQAKLSYAPCEVLKLFTLSLR